jgi:DNA-binding MarR family transcriptional regulator
MSRGYQPEEHIDPRGTSEGREPNINDRPRFEEVREQAANDGPQSPGRKPDHVASRLAEPRTIYELRGRAYRLRNSEIATMVELGKFRAIAQEDLREFVYVSHKAQMTPDVENLIRQGLVRVKSIPHEEKGSRQLLTLTKAGHRLLTENRFAGRDQALYFGFAKPREAHHDADLYRLFQKAADKIERGGGRNLRVVLDYELKKRIYHDLAKLGPDRASAESKRTVAQRHGLQLVRGKIPLPDLRIEYDAPDGERARVDIELATSHYRGRHLADKVRAGFSIYAHAGDVSNLRRVLDQRELTAEILSL